MSSPIDTSASVPPPGLPVVLPPPLFTTAKSGTTAIVLTLAWPGAGHWYAGERDRGIAFAATTLVAAALTLVAPIAGLVATIAFIWALVDARHAVKRAAD